MITLECSEKKIGGRRRGGYPTSVLGYGKISRTTVGTVSHFISYLDLYGINTGLQPVVVIKGINEGCARQDRC